MSLALLFLYLMLNMFRMLIHPSSGACNYLLSFSWVVLFWFDVCWCYVVVWLWWSGIRMQAETLQIIKQVTSSWSLFTQLSAIYIWHLLHLHRPSISRYVFSFRFPLISTFPSVTILSCFCPSWYRILSMWSCTPAKIRVWYSVGDLLSATDHEIHVRQSGLSQVSKGVPTALSLHSQLGEIFANAHCS